MAEGYVQYDNIGSSRESDAPRSAKRLLEIIKDAERRMEPWQNRADRIDKLYSSLQSLDGFDANMMYSDKEYNLFWASVEVIKPSIYSRPPVPVVTVKFNDRKSIKRVTAEMLERTAVAGFGESDIDQVMLGVRDDLVIVARGVIWLTFEDDEDGQRVCIEHLDRKDFGHSIAREWSEVGMVWRIAWLTREEARDRFEGDDYLNANYGSHKDRVGDDAWASDNDKAPFYEVWDKVAKRCYWVAEGCEDYLDDDEPHLRLKKFFPCPKPAYGTLERRSLRPVPDITYIETQLLTINSLTTRIHDLTDKLVVKGIIPAGTDVGDAIEAAMRNDDPSYMLIPVPAMGLSDGAKVEWLPIDMVAQAILSAVEARREIIGNVQELFGIPDIMRGETEAQETKGAQVLKAQFGAVRIRDKVAELVRIAKDTTEIMVEIMAEHFDFGTIVDMSQMELPTDAEIKKQLKEMEKAAREELEALASKAEEVMQSGQAPEGAEQQFQQAQQQIIGKYQPQIAKVSESVTVEQVRKLLRDDKIRPFVFDIETDSTIYPDEQAEKESRNEFMAVFTQASTALAPLAMSGPAGAKMAGAMIKFQLGPYRAGRELEGLIDEWTESLENMPQQPNPEAEKAKAEAENQAAQTKIKMQELELKTQELGLKQTEIQSRATIAEQTERIKSEANLSAKRADAEVAVLREKAQLDADIQTKQMDLDNEAMLAAQAHEFEGRALSSKEALEYAKLRQQWDLEVMKVRSANINAQSSRDAVAEAPQNA